MAKVQISFQDNADNETHFYIYRSTATPVTSADTKIMELEWNSTNSEWEFNQNTTATNPEVTQGASSDPTSSGDTFIVLYDESTADTYYYGVSAFNSVGESGVSSSGAVTVTG